MSASFSGYESLRDLAEKVAATGNTNGWSNLNAPQLAEEVLSLLSENEGLRIALKASPVPNDITVDDLVQEYVEWFHGPRTEALQVEMRRRFGIGVKR